MKKRNAYTRLITAIFVYLPILGMIFFLILATWCRVMEWLELPCLFKEAVCWSSFLTLALPAAFLAGRRRKLKD